MRELTRTNDPVLVSYLRTELAHEGIESFLLDGFASSVLEPVNATAQQRVMVDDDDYWDAWAVLAEVEEVVTENTLLGGRVTVYQPTNGYRAAIDPILLAASVPAENGDMVLDIGTGTGAAAFALMNRQPWAMVRGIDKEIELIALARRAARRHPFAERTSFAVTDIASDGAAGADVTADHVMSNPPYYAAKSGRLPGNKAKADANFETTANLEQWCRFMTHALRDGGTWTMIHRTERVEELLTLLSDELGQIRVLDLLPVDDGRSAKRSIVQAVKGAPRRDVDRTEMVLHGADGAFSADAETILRAGGPSPLVLSPR